jgi:sigma-B regulation protein RsbU (phosphoserine phosphatase)
MDSLTRSDDTGLYDSLLSFDFQMFGRRSRVIPEPQSGPRALLFRTFPGRLFLVSTTVRLFLALLGSLVTLPAFTEVLAAVATLGILLSLGIFTVRLLRLANRRLLWRVRRKLIISYVFMGVIPAGLILVFFLFGGVVMFMNITTYLFKDGYDDFVDEVRVMAQTSAVEIERSARVQDAAAILARRRANLQERYPELSLALVPMQPSETTASGIASVSAGPWRHVPPPSVLPAWVATRGEFAGTLAVIPPDATDEPELLIRAAAPVGRRPGARYAVIVDLPVDQEVVERLKDKTGIRAGDVTVRTDVARPIVGRLRSAASSFFRREPQAPATATTGANVMVLEYYDWQTGMADRAHVSLDVRLRDLYGRLSSAGPRVRNENFGDVILLVLVIVAALFLIIQIVALVMGFALARSITGSVHELFMGTERVRQGDFTHRMKITAQDQLGELANSFNEMTASIEQLLQTEAEKKRLEEELRIARQIQMSLLPPGPLLVPGLEVTALCVPAREVGGDYYDFLALGDRSVGVLIADVSGKGTSAALYMAELKGLVLSLSQIYKSPKDLMIEVNRILSDNLDSRSFITMTYAVIDLNAGTLTYARAGHTPLIYLPASGGMGVQVLTPSGMVLGLRLDGVQEKFTELLEERTLRIGPGDVLVLYTDGVTEAMNTDSDLFGDTRLSRLVEEHGHLESSELRERILREVEAFVGDADQHDDMTMILIKIEQVGAAVAPEPAAASRAV